MFVAFALFYHIRMKLYMPPPFFQGSHKCQETLAQFVALLYSNPRYCCTVLVYIPITVQANGHCSRIMSRQGVQSIEVEGRFCQDELAHPTNACFAFATRSLRILSLSTANRSQPALFHTRFVTGTLLTSTCQQNLNSSSKRNKTYCKFDIQLFN